MKPTGEQPSIINQSHLLPRLLLTGAAAIGLYVAGVEQSSAAHADELTTSVPDHAGPAATNALPPVPRRETVGSHVAGGHESHATQVTSSVVSSATEQSSSTVSASTTVPLTETSHDNSPAQQTATNTPASQLPQQSPPTSAAVPPRVASHDSTSGSAPATGPNSSSSHQESSSLSGDTNHPVVASTTEAAATPVVPNAEPISYARPGDGHAAPSVTSGDATFSTSAPEGRHGNEGSNPTANSPDNHPHGHHDTTSPQSLPLPQLPMGPVPHRPGVPVASSPTEAAPASVAAPESPAPANPEKVGNVVYYSQHDPRWKDIPYGSGNISMDGCGASSLAMVVSSLSDKVITPADAAAVLKSINGVTDTGSTKHAQLVAAPADIAPGLRSQVLSNFSDLNVVRQVLDAGGLIMINGTDAGHDDPSTPATTGGHFIVIRGVTPSGDILIADPNSRANSVKEFAPDKIFGPAWFAVAVYPAEKPASQPTTVPTPAAPTAPVAPTATPSAPTSSSAASSSSEAAKVQLPPQYSVNMPVPARPTAIVEVDGLPAVPHRPGTPPPAPALAPVPKPAPAPVPTAPPDDTNKYKPLLDTISIGESHGNYDAYFGHGNNVDSPRLTDMTIAQVLAFQQQLLDDDSPSTAVGRYQDLNRTLLGVAEEDHVDLNTTKFDEHEQDELAIVLLKNRGLDDFEQGRITWQQFAHNIAKEWASLPSVTGPHPESSVYEGDGLNHAIISIPQIEHALEEIKH